MTFIKMLSKYRVSLFSAALIFVATGCTVHPDGEKQERQSAEQEGKPFAKHPGDRTLPTLSAQPSRDELVNYALLASPELEQRYWEWRSAIEQIPQDGTQATNLAVSAGVPITKGSTALNRTTATIGNDPMADIVWPSKLSAAANRALDHAKASGYRFQKAKYDLRQKVLDAYYDYVLAVQLLRLDQSDLQLLTTSAAVTESGISSGKATQLDAIKARNDVDVLQNQITEEEARLPGLIAALNSAMGRDPELTINPITALPPNRKIMYTADELLHLADERNPDLAAISAEHAAHEQDLRLTQLQYVPDFSLSASSDLGGQAQSLFGMVTVPYLRYEAIHAAIAQAEANLRASDAMRRQSRNDIRSRVVTDMAFLQGAETQLEFLDRVIVPRVRQSTEITQYSYESGHATMMELFDSKRSAIAIERLVVQLNVVRERYLADLEAVVGNLVAPLSLP